MKKGGFAVALIANQDEGFAKFIAAVHTIAHHFFQQGPNFRIITGQPVQGMIQQIIMGGGVVRPRDFVCNDHIRGELFEGTIPDIVKAVAESNDIWVGGLGVFLNHDFQIGQDFRTPRPFQVADQLDHGPFNLTGTGNIDTILVNVKLVIDLHNMVVVLQVGGELIKQEGFIPEEGCFLEGIIPKDHIKFLVGKGLFQHITVNQPDTFTGFFLGEIVTLKGQNVVEQGLVPPITFPKVREIIVAFHWGQPLGKFLNLPFREVIQNGPFHATGLQDFIAVIGSNLSIRGDTHGQGAFRPAFFNTTVLEQEVFSPCGGVHSALQF